MRQTICLLGLTLAASAAAGAVPLLNMRQAAVRFTTNEDGIFTTCAIDSDAYSAELKAEICDALRTRGRMAPPSNNGESQTLNFRWIAGTRPSQSIVQPDRTDVGIKPPQGAPWLTAEDYPTHILKAGSPMRVGLQWNILPSGRVTNCKTIQSSGNTTVDAYACEIVLTRGLYTKNIDTARTVGPVFLTFQR